MKFPSTPTLGTSSLFFTLKPKWSSKKNWNLLLSLPMLGGLQWIPSSGEGLEGILQSLLGLQPMFSTWLTRLYTIWPSFTSSFHLTTSFLLLSRFYLHCLLSGAQCTVLLLISEPLYMLFLYPRMLFPLYFLTLTSCGRLSNDLSPAPKDVHVLTPEAVNMLSYIVKGTLQMRLKILGRRDCSHYPGGIQCNHKGPYMSEEWESQW